MLRRAPSTVTRALQRITPAVARTAVTSTRIFRSTNPSPVSFSVQAPHLPASASSFSPTLSAALASIPGGFRRGSGYGSRFNAYADANPNSVAASLRAIAACVALLTGVSISSALSPSDESAPAADAAAPAAVAAADAAEDPFADMDDWVLPSRGEPATPADLEGPVKVVVTDSVDALLLDANKDVLLDIYSPTCAQCGAFAIVWDALAVALADVPTLTVGKMDGVANYKRGLLSGAEEYTFPNVKVYPAGEEKRAAFDEAEAWTNNKAAAQQQAREAKKSGDAEGLAAAVAALPEGGPRQVGEAWEMRWRPTELICDALVDWAWEKVTHKFDKDAIKAKLRAAAPAMRERLIALHSASLPAGEVVARAAPCASEWARASQIMFLSQVGMHSDAVETADAFRAFKGCLMRTERESNRFWKSVLEHSDFIVSVLKSEKEKDLAEKAAAAAAGKAVPMPPKAA